MENVLLGTDLKLKVELICEGFSMDDDDFDITVKWGNNSNPYHKHGPISGTCDKSTELIRHESTGDWFLCLPTDGMKGLVTMVAKLYVPDTDFDNGGKRREVVKKDMFVVNRP